MLPIAPIDYERYTVVHSPLLVAQTGHDTVFAPTRITEPVVPSAITQRRHERLPQDLVGPTGENIGLKRSTRSHLIEPNALNSSLPVELSSIAGVSPEVLYVTKEHLEPTPRAAAERYEPSGGASTATFRVSA